MIVRNLVQIPLYLILSICLLLTTIQSTYAYSLPYAEGQIGLMELLPNHLNGDRGLFAEYHLADGTQNQSVGEDDIIYQRFYSIDDQNKSIIFTPYFDQLKADPIFRLPFDEDGAVHISGEAGLGKSEEGVFSIEIGNAERIYPVWTKAGGGAFDITIPYEKGDSLYLNLSRTNDSSLEGSYWKDVQLSKSQVNQEKWISTTTVQADQDPSIGQWTDTGLTVTKDFILSIQSSGVARHGMNKNYTQWYSTFPDGKRYFLYNHQQQDQKMLWDETAIVPSAPIGALIGIIQLPDETWSSPFMIGSKSTFKVPETGKLYFGYNDLSGNYFNNSGSYTAEVHFYNEDANVTVDPPKDEIQSLEVTRDFYRLLPGKSEPISVVAVYSDGHKQDITKDKQVTYVSNHPDILQGSLGMIKAGKNPGDAVVTISYQGASTTINGIVSTSFPKTIRANPSHFTLSLGEEVTPTVDAFYSDKSYNDLARYMDWYSEKPDIANIEDGKIVGISPGTTTIVGNYADLGQVKIQVTVNLGQLMRIAPDKVLISLNMSNSSTPLISGINRDKSSYDMSDKVTWTTSNAGVADIQNGSIIPHGIGTATLTASYYNLKTTITVHVTP